MKHCFLCRWSFGATEYSEGEEPALKPILKCWPGGDRTIEKMATALCEYYDPEDGTQKSRGGKNEQ